METSKIKHGRIAKQVDTKCGVPLYRVVGPTRVGVKDVKPVNSVTRATDLNALHSAIERINLD